MLWVIFIGISFSVAFWVSQNFTQQTRLMILAFVPLIALAIYIIIGNPAMAGRPQKELLKIHKFNPNAIAAKIENNLSANPEQYKGWQVLGFIQLSLGNFYQAQESYLRADMIKPNQADILIGIAQAKFLASGELITEDSLKLVQRTLKLNNENIPALYLQALALAQEEKPKQAALILKRALVLIRKKNNKQFQALLEETLDKVKKQGYNSVK